MSEIPPAVPSGAPYGQPIGPQHQMPPQPKKKHTGVIVLCVIAAVVVLCSGIGLASCNAMFAGTDPAASSSPAATEAAAGDEGGETDSPSPAPAKSKTPKLGVPFTVADLNGSTAHVTIDGPTWQSDSTYGTENGGYVTFEVTIAAVSGSWTYNPLYFSLRAADGTEYDSMSGMFAGDLLSAGKISNPGKARGKIAFDAPQNFNGDLEMQDASLMGPIAIWPIAG